MKTSLLKAFVDLKQRQRRLVREIADRTAELDQLDKQVDAMAVDVARYLAGKKTAVQVDTIDESDFYRPVSYVVALAGALGSSVIVQPVTNRYRLTDEPEVSPADDQPGPVAAAHASVEIPGGGTLLLERNGGGLSAVEDPAEWPTFEIDGSGDR